MTTTIYPWNRPPRAQALFYGAVNMAVIATVALLCAHGFVDKTRPALYYGLYATGILFGVATLATLLASVSRAANEPVPADDQHEVALALPAQRRRLAITATPMAPTKAVGMARVIDGTYPLFGPGPVSAKDRLLHSPYPIAGPRGPHWP